MKVSGALATSLVFTAEEQVISDTDDASASSTFLTVDNHKKVLKRVSFDLNNTLEYENTNEVSKNSTQKAVRSILRSDYFSVLKVSLKL